MNTYITTNIRLSEEDYMRLKTEALKKRKSLSAIIREKLSNETVERSPDEVEKILQKLRHHAKQVASKLKDIDGTEIIHEMRYNSKW